MLDCIPSDGTRWIVFLNSCVTKFLILSLVLCLAAAGQASAAEPARAFLDGLRARGLHDVAIDYLDMMSTSPLAPSELKETILYEKALTLVASARTQRNIDASGKLLDDAQKLLQKFVRDQPSHPKGNSARSQLGSLIFERARTKVEQAKRGNKEALIAEARALYEQAFAVFNGLQSVVSKELEQIPKVLDVRDRKQAKLAERRKQLRADNLQTELLAAAVREESANTFPDGSNEYLKNLDEAALLYDAIYKNYRGRLAGFYARMYQGRCNQRLGKLRDALGYYGELLEQPNESDGMFILKTKTLRLAMECWLAPSQRKYVETIKRGAEWLAMAPANQDRQADWLSIRLSLAKAYKMQAEAAQKQQPPVVRLARESVTEAKTHAKFVATEPGPFQEEAQALVTALGGVISTAVAVEPRTFAEAQSAAKEALDEIEPARRKMQVAQTALAATQEDDSTELQNRFANAKGEFELVRSDAIRYYRLALQLADRDTPQADVNLVRYFLCYLHYLQKDYFDSALLGDFVARRYPDAAGARECAKIAMACYLMLFVENEGQDRQFEVNRLVAIANHIADRWPGKIGDDSLSAIVPHMVNAGELDHARQLTERITETSPARLNAELVTGQAYWAAAINRRQQIGGDEPNTALENVDSDSPQSEVALLQQQAIRLLDAALARLPESPEVTTSSATAILSLARAHVTTGNNTKAIEVLEHPLLGPLTLVDGQDPAVANVAFEEETYRTALQAYVGSIGTNGDSMMDSARRVMSSLQETVADNPAGQQRLLSVYTNLALSIETQMELASTESKQELSEVFETFLGQLATGATDPGVLNWVAETLARIGSGFDEEETLNPNALKYYERSVVAFQNLLNDPAVPPATATQIRVRMASVMGKMRQFDQAMAALEQVLAANANAVNVQVEAARLLQRWARQDPTKYQQAIAGIDSPSNVWGWAKIAAGTQTHREFRDLFYEARYEIAHCQFESANSQSGAGKRKLLTSAERILKQTQMLYPTLGGDHWTRRYGELLNDVLVAQGKPPLSLKPVAPKSDDATISIEAPMINP